MFGSRRALFFLLLQKRLEAFHALADLLSVVQAEEGVLRGQLGQLHPAQDENEQHKTTTGDSATDSRWGIQFYAPSKCHLT